MWRHLSWLEELVNGDRELEGQVLQSSTISEEHTHAGTHTHTHTHTITKRLFISLKPDNIRKQPFQIITVRVSRVLPRQWNCYTASSAPLYSFSMLAASERPSVPPLPVRWLWLSYSACHHLIIKMVSCCPLPEFSGIKHNQVFPVDSWCHGVEEFQQ